MARSIGSLRLILLFVVVVSLLLLLLFGRGVPHLNGFVDSSPLPPLPPVVLPLGLGLCHWLGIGWDGTEDILPLLFHAFVAVLLSFLQLLLLLLLL